MYNTLDDTHGNYPTLLQNVILLLSIFLCICIYIPYSVNYTI